MRPTSVNAGPGHWATAVVAAVLAVVLAAGALGIAVAQHQARNRDLALFTSRVGTSAAYVAAAVDTQAQRQASVATALLAGASVQASELAEASSGLGAVAVVVVGPANALVAATGTGAPDLASTGATVLAAAAARGRAVSEGIALPGLHGTAVMIAVPYATGSGRRVVGAVYVGGGAVLAAFVSHVSLYQGHQTYLVDQTGGVIVADPPATAPSSGLAHLPGRVTAAVASLHAAPTAGVRVGPVGSGATVAEAAVAETSWRLLVVAPDTALFAPSSGIATVVPWLVWGAVLLLAAAMVVLASRFVRQHRELVATATRLGEVARTDELTGIANRRSLIEEHGRLAEVSARYGHTYAVLMADLDRFKDINDTYGHEAGDRYLVAAAGCLRRALRDTDIVGRWGGDEFLALLPETGPDGAEDAARRVVGEGLATLVEMGSSKGDPVRLPVRFSAGWAEATRGTDPDTAVHAADLSLYRAKASGNGTDGQREGSRSSGGATATVVTDPPVTGEGPAGSLR
ncbi:MAG: GGDEF domain-containing protein [Actinomycetota bacterium]|nr:GGDEF domain-containing protein [Actinomycetota bacterium]